MERAFEEALVEDSETFLCVCEGLPDANDEHGLAAALKTRAAMIVTTTSRIFPKPS
jgi:hypothetical protein